MLARRLVGSKEIDPYWNNVELLINPAGADGSTSFTDLSGKYSPYVEGSPLPQVSSALGKKSILFGGGTNNLRINNTLSFLHDGATPWTFDFGVYQASFTSVESLYMNTNYNFKRKYLQILMGPSGGADEGYIQAIVAHGAEPVQFVATASGLRTSIEEKIRVSMDGSNLRIHVNGVLKATTARPALSYGTDGDIRNGAFGAYINTTGSRFPLTAHITGIRITKNVVRPGSEIFTVPFPTR